MLRYLQCKLAEDRNNLIIPIRFKTEFDAEDKKIMVRAASNVKETTAEGVEDFKGTNDTINIWQVYMINQLFSKCDENDGEYHLFEDTQELTQIRRLLKVN